MIEGNLKSTPRRPRTTLAFLLSPGIAALAGAIVWAAWTLLTESDADASIGNVVATAFSIAFCLAVVGYVTAFFIAVPVYKILPERARRTAWIVVPLAGAIAAVPWIPFFATSGFVALPICIIFGLGCFVGIVFLVIRGCIVERRSRAGWLTGLPPEAIGCIVP